MKYQSGILLCLESHQVKPMPVGNDRACALHMCDSLAFVQGISRVDGRWSMVLAISA